MASERVVNINSVAQNALKSFTYRLYVYFFLAHLQIYNTTIKPPKIQLVPEKTLKKKYIKKK